MAKFKPGNKMGKGRPKGAKNFSRLDTLKEWERSGLFKLAEKAIRDCVSSKDPSISGPMSRWVVEQRNGKAPQAIEVAGKLSLVSLDI